MYVPLHRADPILSVEIVEVHQRAHACKIMLERHHRADRNAQLIQNVQAIYHVLIKSVQTLALVHVAQMLHVLLLITPPCVPVIMDLPEIRSHIVNQSRVRF